MNGSSLQFNVRDLLEKAKRLPRPKVKGVTLSLPFVSVDIEIDDSDKKIAREVLLRLRDKRVLVASECCDSCIKNSLASIQDIRALLVDKQVALTDDNSPLFVVFDLMLLGIRQFLTYTERFDPNHDRQYYFDSLNILREHLLRCVTAISEASGVEPKFTNRMTFDPKWSDKIYLNDSD